MPQQQKPGGVRRLIFTGNVRTNLFNAYTPGANIGGLNASVRRALNRRATLTPGTLFNMNSRKPGCGQCNTIAGTGSNTKSNNNTNVQKEINNLVPVVPLIE